MDWNSGFIYLMVESDQKYSVQQPAQHLRSQTTEIKFLTTQHQLSSIYRKKSCFSSSVFYVIIFSIWCQSWWCAMIFMINMKAAYICEHISSSKFDSWTYRQKEELQYKMNCSMIVWKILLSLYLICMMSNLFVSFASQYINLFVS